MKYLRSSLPVIVVLVFVAGCNMAPKPGSPESGYTVWGYVGKTPSEPAAGMQVLLFNGKQENPVASASTNFLGKYTFSQLPPGYYKVKVADKIMEVVVTNKNQRIDIDLSSETGAMNYAADALKNAVGTGKPGGDSVLAQRFAGKWYSFSGGGSESQMAFCPDGNYYESYEASYSGSSSDQYGNETMNWGQASASSGDGTWSIEGTVQKGTITVKYRNGSTTTISYQQSNDDPQCYYFDGRLHCYNGACQ